VNGDLLLVIFCSLVQDRRSTASTDQFIHFRNTSAEKPWPLTSDVINYRLSLQATKVANLLLLLA